MSYLKTSYEILFDVLNKGAFTNLRLSQDINKEDRKLVHKLVYGCLEHYFEINSIIKGLCPKFPKKNIQVVLMQAIYAIRYLSIPSYAIVNESVNLAREVENTALKGFVNAILNKVVRQEYTLNNDNEEIFYNLPQWLIDAVKKEYPHDYDTILRTKGNPKQHVRLSKDYSASQFEAETLDFEKTQTGYYVAVTDKIKQLFSRGLLTYQSLTSTLVVQSMGKIETQDVFDACAAPGGKSVLMAEKGANVTAGELYPHRIKLIEAYARRMRVAVSAIQNDATIFQLQHKEKYDIVLLDAPCSGFGVIGKRPDIVLTKVAADIERLGRLQLVMINNVCRYVKAGGMLVYSTCTIFKKENRAVIDDFLAKNPNFSLVFDRQYLQDGSGIDGFYIAQLKRID